jgi:hypothetical protein
MRPQGNGGGQIWFVGERSGEFFFHEKKLRCDASGREIATADLTQKGDKVGQVFFHEKNLGFGIPAER